MKSHYEETITDTLFPKSFCVNQSFFQQYSGGETCLLIFYSHTKEEDIEDVFGS